MSRIGRTGMRERDGLEQSSGNRNRKSYHSFEHYRKITNMNLCEIRKDFLNSASFKKSQGKEFL